MKRILALFLLLALLLGGCGGKPGQEEPEFTLETGIAAEGAEDFRYIGQENQHHIYRGIIKPGAKIKLVMQATLARQSSLPLTGRTCTARMEVIAKKGGEVIKRNSFKHFK